MHFAPASVQVIAKLSPVTDRYMTELGQETEATTNHCQKTINLLPLQIFCLRHPFHHLKGADILRLARVSHNTERFILPRRIRTMSSI